ncbi:NAD(P)-dependent alcohol dehydrogenase [Sphingosinicellaceae bacterium]|nr:NAD(P)-dependent alcohol dehydrogenase [Sphingosinicellaceae bacterium]
MGDAPDGQARLPAARTVSDRTPARAAVLRTQGGKFLVEPISIEAPRNDEVLVRVRAAGLCHTDLIARDQLYPVPQPIVLGHEGAGIVERVGAGVTKVAPGDRVVMSFLACGTCPNCRAGAPAYCAELFGLCFGGCRPDGSSALADDHGGLLHGHFFGQSSFATHAMASERNVVKLPDTIPFELAAPLACGLQTGAGAVLNVLRPRLGESIALFGAGAVGLSAVMAAKAIGAGPVIVVDPNPARLALALELGADLTIDPTALDPVATIRKQYGGARFSLEATGRADVLRQAIDALMPRGVCGIVGAPALGVEACFDVSDVMVGGKTIRGIVEGDSVPDRLIPELIRLHAEGLFPIEKLVRTYTLDQINDAVADAEAGTVVKPVIVFA